MNFGLSEKTIQKLYSIFAKYPEVEEAIIYGSRAKGNYRESSDIDITLKGEELNNEISSKIRQELENSNIPYLVDLSIYHHLQSDSLIEQINKVGKILYKR
ncbi:MAG: nucleotidyltransferase domain-containing protein [Bacteroidia bacterium]|nr:nucleotidyltransferase domain-containing protein [Bacteroidia bacterium]MDW8158877.1 nucleotidyltransferase domain-containing protein [Bacteroidia bacterium]